MGWVTGFADYMPIAYVDIDPVTGFRNKSGGGMLNADRVGARGLLGRSANDRWHEQHDARDRGLRPPDQTAGHYNQATIYLGFG